MSRYDPTLIDAWLTARCVRSPDARTRNTDLFASWKAWQAARRRPICAMATFGGMLHAAGFPRWQDSYSTGVTGVMLRPEPATMGQIESLITRRDTWHSMEPVT